MNTLTIAFSPEGPTDVRFLSSVIRRTAEELLARYAQAEADVLEPFAFPHSKGDGLSGAERLLEVARKAKGLHCLIIHADADDTSPQAALAERVDPALRLIAADVAAQQQVVPLVPVTMTETWMLADTDLLQEALDTELDVIRDLQLPRPNRAEQVAHPKHELERAIHQIQEALPSRQRQPSHELMTDLYTQLSDIPLDSLRRLPSYQRFEESLLSVLVALNLARR